jgi:molybdopterin synthase sulfur carrier subunit
MAKVTFARHLQHFFPTLCSVDVQAGTLAEVIAAVDRQFPGIAAYLVDDQGALRKHVNMFIGEEIVRDRTTLRDAVSPGDEVCIFQALSGG